MMMLLSVNSGCRWLGMSFWSFRRWLPVPFLYLTLCCFCFTVRVSSLVVSLVPAVLKFFFFFLGCKSFNRQLEKNRTFFSNSAFTKRSYSTRFVRFVDVGIMLFLYLTTSSGKLITKVKVAISTSGHRRPSNRL